MELEVRNDFKLVSPQKLDSAEECSCVQWESTLKHWLDNAAFIGISRRYQKYQNPLTLRGMGRYGKCSIIQAFISSILGLK